MALKKEGKNISRVLIRIILGIAVFVLVLLLFVTSKLFQSQKAIEVKEEKKIEKITRRAIDGKILSSNEDPVQQISAVIIDNHPSSRPAFGLSKAPLVMEIPVEGGITRFLAFYIVDDFVPVIGPIRSLRSYFLDWALEFGKPQLVHIGGSPDSLELLREKQEKFIDIDEFKSSTADAFWRTRDRIAPHNAFTNTDRLSAFKEDNVEYKSWIWQEDPKEVGEVNEIKIDFSTPKFKVTWKYNPEKNDYIRYVKEEIVSDNLGNNIRAKNILIVFTEAPVIDDVGRRRVRTLGEGKSLVFNNGNVLKGKWQKKSPEQRLRFYDEEGKEITMNAGISWIEIVPPEGEVIY